MPVGCHPLTPPDNGEVTCTAGSQAGSVCAFACDEGYMMKGAYVTLCEVRVYIKCVMSRRRATGTTSLHCVTRQSWKAISPAQPAAYLASSSA